jgi:polyisoprenoid-binding protein YceI
MKATFSLLILLALFSSDVRHLMMDLKGSQLQWEATKKFGQHNGEVGILEGIIDVKNDTIVGGKVKLNMNDIQVMDIKDESDKKKLVKELRSKELFHVSKYPTITFELIQMKKDSAIGVLSIKNKSKRIAIALKDYGRNANGQYFITSDWYYINRAFWNLEWKNWLLNGVVDDEFRIRFQVVSKE